MADKPQPAESKPGLKSKPGSTSVSGATSRSTVAIGIAVAAVMGLLAVVAVMATSKDTKSVVATSGTAAAAGASAGTVETAAVRVSGTALLPMSDGAPDAGIGAAAPRLDGQRFDSSAISIAPGSEPMVIVFVAHWCPHCQREVPLLAKWAVGGTSDGVAVRAVSTSVSSDRPNYPPSEWLSRENFTIPTMVDGESSEAASAYGLTSFPYFVAVDASGAVVSRVSGEITAEQFAQLVATAKGSG